MGRPGGHDEAGPHMHKIGSGSLADMLEHLVQLLLAGREAGGEPLKAAIADAYAFLALNYEELIKAARDRLVQQGLLHLVQVRAAAPSPAAAGTPQRGPAPARHLHTMQLQAQAQPAHPLSADWSPSSPARTRARWSWTARRPA